MREDALTPYRGPFGREQATRLLTRAAFGASPGEVAKAVDDGLGPTLDRLFAPPPARRSDDSFTRMGTRIARRQNLANVQAHWLLRMIRSPHPVSERLALLWHGHFATAHTKVQDTVAMYDQNLLFLREGAGPFPKLLEDVAKDPAMLIWLDNDKSSKRHPNENFARELFELFSLGRGHYSESDIREAARAFTGWQVDGGRFRYQAAEHDDGMKTVLGKSGRLSGRDVLELCGERPECPAFIASKLYRHFVEETCPPDLEERLGRALEKGGMQVGPFVRRLVGSEPFFAAERMIKSPVVLVVGALRTLQARCNALHLARSTAAMGQELYDPPSVAGWERGRAWINSATLTARQNFGAEVARGAKSELRCRIGLPAGTSAREVADVLAGGALPDDAYRGIVETVGVGLAQVAGAVLNLPEAQLM